MHRESSCWDLLGRRCPGQWTVWLLVLFAVPPCLGDDPILLGVVDERPEQGSYVAVDGQFLVPYRTTIPGTDIEYEMVPIPGGTFEMGHDADGRPDRADESPAIRIHVDPMWIGKYEITQAQYREFELLYHIFLPVRSRSGGERGREVDSVTAPTPLYSPGDTYRFGDGPNYPAVAMTQYAAQQFTKWLSAISSRQYRLPTEAEWEYACRAGSKGRYAWGDDPKLAGQFAWCFENATEGFRPVGKKEPNAFGLFDMHGNVGEWTVNAYTPNGYRWLSGRPRVTAIEAVVWPQQETSCVVRGGMWDSGLDALRCAARLESDAEAWKDQDPDLPNSPWWFSSEPALSIGFRIVRSFHEVDEPTIAKFWDHTSPEVWQKVESRIKEGRGGIIPLDENLLPTMAKQRERLKELTRRREERRQRIRAARPD